ncbi:MAG: hypothetical protein ABI947_29825 [Chloroflexota bacterium]
MNPSAKPSAETIDTAFFEYLTEPLRDAVLIAIVPLVLALFFNVLIVRLLLLSIAAGPTLWAIMQWQRRGRGVTLADNQLLIQNPLTGRTRCIDYAIVEGIALLPTNKLVVAYVQAAPEKPVGSGSLALTDAHPIDQRPRRSLVVTEEVNQARELEALLGAQLQALNGNPLTLTPEFVIAWAKRRRTRNLILLLLGVLATPLYVMIIFRVFASILGTNFGR